MHKAKNKHGPDTDVGIRRALARAAEVTPGKHPPWMEIRYGPQCTEASRGDPPGERCRTGTGKRDGPGEFTRGPDKIWPPGIPEGESQGRSDKVEWELRPCTRMVSTTLDHREKWKSKDRSQRVLPLVSPSPCLHVPQIERRCELRAKPRDIITKRRTGESPPGIVNRITINNIDSSARIFLPARGRLEVGEFKDNYCLTATTMFCCKGEMSSKQEYFEKMTRGHGDIGTRGVESPGNVPNENFLSSHDMETERRNKENEFRWSSEVASRWLSEVETTRYMNEAETTHILNN